MKIALDCVAATRFMILSAKEPVKYKNTGNRPSRQFPDILEVIESGSLL
jgi:hypothetical protein